MGRLCLRPRGERNQSRAEEMEEAISGLKCTWRAELTRLQDV
jgi:hypothetical protein